MTAESRNCHPRPSESPALFQSNDWSHFGGTVHDDQDEELLQNKQGWCVQHATIHLL